MIRFLSGSIELFIGLPGSGKSYCLTRTVQQYQRKYEGLPVYSNMPMKGATFYQNDDLFDLPPGLICIDEIHLLASSRGAMKLPADHLRNWSQTRKFGWHILGTTQHEARVDSVVRHNSLFFHQINAWGTGTTPTLFVEKSFAPEDFRKPKKHLTRSVHFFDKKIASSYSTTFSIDSASHLKD